MGPPSLPLARMVCQARSASRFSDTRFERGVASNNAFYLPFFDATAEYHRSDESSDSCALPGWAWCVRGAEHRAETGGGCASGYQGVTRGWVLKYGPYDRGQARERGTERPDCPTPLLARRHRPRPGAVCHAAFRRRDGRASSVELRDLAGKPAGSCLLRERVAVRTAARGRSPSGLSATGA